MVLKVFETLKFYGTSEIDRENCIGAYQKQIVDCEAI